jgi:aarF domain-containing kinase
MGCCVVVWISGQANGKRGSHVHQGTEFRNVSLNLPLIYFTQLAQWAGSRADLFPTILCDRLGALHSNGRPHSLTHTKRVISRVFHRPFSEVFDSFDEDPIGTGAIAQVYKAILRADLLPPDYLDPKRSTPPLKADLQDLKQRLPGLIDPANLGSNPPPSVPTSAVALKILHPKVSNLINRDLQIMSFFASCLTFIPGMQWLSLPEEVEVFGQMMRDQLDMRIEAENLKTFERNFAERKAPVTFPRPLDAWSNSEVIVEEYMNALPLKTFLSNGGGPFDQRIANLGLDAFLVNLSLRVASMRVDAEMIYRICFSSTTSVTRISTQAT